MGRVARLASASPALCEAGKGTDTAQSILIRRSPRKDVGAGGGRQLFAHLPSPPRGPAEVRGEQAAAVAVAGGVVPGGSAEAVAVAGVERRAGAGPELLRSDLSSKNIQLSAWLRSHLFTS